MHGSHALVTGFGRTSKTICALLRSLGAQVTVAARKQADLAWAQVEGMHGVFYEELPAYAGGFDYVVNTVPALVLGGQVWRSCRRIACLLKLRPRRGESIWRQPKRVGSK